MRTGKKKRVVMNCQLEIVSLLKPVHWDDCFGFYDGVKVKLLWPGKLAMTMISSANSLVVFDKQPDATCINPLTQAPNAINLTPEFVTPDKPLVIETRWQFTPES